MPETLSDRDPAEEPGAAERVTEVAEQAIAGSGIVRTTILYVVLGVLMVSPVPVLGIVPLILLLATDPRFAP